MIPEANKVLIEQSLYGITEGPYPHGEDYLTEAIYQYFESKAPKVTLHDVLYESICYSDEFSKYIPLLEAVDDIKTSEQKLKDAKEETDQKDKAKWINKATAALHKALKWWYGADSPTMAKNLRLIVRVICAVAIFILKWKLGKGAETADKIRHLGRKSEKLKKFADNKIFEPADFVKNSPNIELPFDDWLTGKKMNINVAVVCVSLLVKGLKRLDHEIYYQINLEDLDANIARIDKLITEFDEAIDDETDPELKANLKKGRQHSVNALRDLLLIKEEKKKREDNKEKFDKLKKKIMKGDNDSDDDKKSDDKDTKK